MRDLGKNLFSNVYQNLWFESHSVHRVRRRQTCFKVLDAKNNYVRFQIQNRQTFNIGVVKMWLILPLIRENVPFLH